MVDAKQKFVIDDAQKDILRIGMGARLASVDESMSARAVLAATEELVTTSSIAIPAHVQ